MANLLRVLIDSERDSENGAEVDMLVAACGSPSPMLEAGGEMPPDVSGRLEEQEDPNKVSLREAIRLLTDLYKNLYGEDYFASEINSDSASPESTPGIPVGGIPA